MRNNVGVDGIRLWVRGKLQDGEVVLAQTGQRFPVEGAPAESRRPWLGFTAKGYDTPGSRAVLVWRGEADAPPSVGPPPEG